MTINAQVQDAETLTRYPHNVSLKNLYWFWVAPTLCYQVHYPRSKRVRKRHVLSHLGRMAVFLGLMLFMAEQYVQPTIQNSLQHIESGDIGAIAERVLKLSIPNTYIWLFMFYSVFHLGLNQLLVALLLHRHRLSLLLVLDR